MAEFQDVIKQMKRMCNHLSPTCNGCKLCVEKGTNAICGEEPKDIRSDPALVEAVVMAWAEEHPEPVYPTWWSWLINEGVIANGSTYTGAIDQLKMHPIPVDIAEKLGIEPKEG